MVWLHTHIRSADSSLDWYEGVKTSSIARLLHTLLIREPRCRNRAIPLQSYWR